MVHRKYVSKHFIDDRLDRSPTIFNLMSLQLKKKEKGVFVNVKRNPVTYIIKNNI